MALRLSQPVQKCAQTVPKPVILIPLLYIQTPVRFFNAQRLDFFTAIIKPLAFSSGRFICSTATLRRDTLAKNKPPDRLFLQKGGEELLSIPHPQRPQHPHSTYSSSPFTDLRVLTLSAGSGGNGCVSFLREKFVPNGPANGGDGGTGGAVYIQAVYGETSLHKIARDGAVQATAGRNGQGSAVNGKRGDDIVIRVPVGTVVREISRWDPAVEELGECETQYATKTTNTSEEQREGGEILGSNRKHGENEYWLHYPRSLSQNLQSPQFNDTAFPFHHHRSSSELLAQTHPTPVYLDLSEPTMQPILLLPGAPGGFGNPHFVSTELRRPKFATKGGKGARMKIQLELKILADVGLVGLPNAGKSSFLRSVSRKQARVGEWAFTTLSPNIGTIVLDERTMLPEGPLKNRERQKRPRFMIADIPGLIADAHLNKGLGHGFLRHIERAKVLGFVLDLSRDDPVGDLEGLWKEVRAYEQGGDKGGDVRGMMSEMTGNINASLESIEELDHKQEFVAEQIEEEKEKQKDGGLEKISEKQELEGRGMPLVHFPGVGAFLPRREAPISLKKFEENLDLEAELLYPRQERPNLGSKAWFVIANKADLPGTEEKYWVLKNYLMKETMKRNDGEEIGLLPISALRGQGVDKVVDWMKGMLGF